jgi:LmbE family N-acetylglucosaminyl deacetylase
VHGASTVARHLEEIAPDLIVTFGPDGLAGHPDHCAVSRWVTEAWAVACPHSELWYATVTEDFHRRWGPVNDSVGFFGQLSAPPSTPPEDVVHRVVLDRAMLDLKLAALRAHVSQTPPLIERLGVDRFRRCGAPRPSAPRPPARS